MLAFIILFVILLLLYLASTIICVRLSKVKSHEGQRPAGARQSETDVDFVPMERPDDAGTSHSQIPQNSEAADTTAVDSNDAEPIKSPPEDVVDVASVDDKRKFLVARQFHNYQKLVIRIITTAGEITDIRITALTPYANSNYKGLAFELPSVADFYRFAKRADDKFAQCLRPLENGGENVTDVELANAILTYFDDRDMRVYGKLYVWERETRSIHQVGVDLSTYDNVVWDNRGVFRPDSDTEASVSVEYDRDLLLCVNIDVDRPDPDRYPLYRVKESLTIIDTHAAYALQKALGVEPKSVYDSLTKRFEPFDTAGLSALKDYLQQHNIKHTHEISDTKVEQSKLAHTIPVSCDHNVPESNGYVPHGRSRDYSITIYHVGDIITKVEYEYKTVTSGYWHDNPNYPYSDVSSNGVVIDDMDQIARLAHSLGIAENKPKSLMDKIKGLFRTQNDFVIYLDSHQIKHTAIHT